MAKKKFSRLSVLLEARDKMSSTFNAAANSSEKLSAKVRKLQGTLDKSRSSITKTTVQQRALSQGYRDISRSLTTANDKTNIFVRSFDRMPQAFKNAMYTAEGYARSIYNVTFKNKVATASFRTLTNVTKYSGIALWNIGNAATSAAGKLMKMTGVSKGLSYLSKQIQGASERTLAFARNTKIAVMGLKLYKDSKAHIKAVADNIKLVTHAQKVYAKNSLEVAKSSKYWNILGKAINAVQRPLRSTTLAFTLFKNSSKSVDVVSKGFSKMISPIKKVESTLRNLINSFRKVDNAAGKLQGRRATFNQLAESNARLNNQLQKMNRELSRANSRLSSMRTNMGSLNVMATAFSAAFAGQAAVNVGQNATKETVGYAMEQQYNKASVGILAGPENGAKFYEKIQGYASTTAYATEEWSKNMRGAIGKSKTVEDLEKYMIVMEQLATLDPVQGLDGAALAVRELNSGDIVSLVERFELPRSALKQIKDIKNPIEQIQALSKLVGDETGYTVDNIQKMKELPLMQWQKATNIWKTMKGYVGEGALKVIAPYIEKFNKMWDNKEFDGYIASASQKLGNFAKGVIDFVKNFGSNMDSFKQKNSGLIGLWDNVVATFEEAKPKISQIFSNVLDIINKFASSTSEIWPQINSVIQTGLDALVGFTGFVKNNFNGVLALVIGLATGFATWKIIGMVTVLWNGVTKAILFFKGATTLAAAAMRILNLVMKMNPIGLVISLVAGLAAAFYVAYQKSETFREIVQKCLNWLKDVGAGILLGAQGTWDDLAGAISWAGDKISDTWSKLKEFYEYAKTMKIDWGAILPGGNSFITFGADKKEKADGKHKGGINNIPHDNYKAILHKGERVLTRDENKNYGQGGGGVVVTGNSFSVREEADVVKVATEIVRQIDEQRKQR